MITGDVFGGTVNNASCVVGSIKAQKYQIYEFVVPPSATPIKIIPGRNDEVE